MISFCTVTPSFSKGIIGSKKNYLSGPREEEGECKGKMEGEREGVKKRGREGRREIGRAGERDGGSKCPYEQYRRPL